ncbi:MAG: fumarylacetoacetate hydrolase family protein [Francisellaceae bacterium]|jgi:fumarylacetoacetate (FAA) hydrolase|nr:fumarylacetoacetate hydrolase family protein [Francisellaceae bacterium]MBT6538767.1 fumarylacetoacetate hydrolase family protein [Francisellaceae bacterium]
MKLATLKDNSRDGQLIVVSKDLTTAVLVQDIVPTMQKALDDWETYAPQLNTVYQTLNAGKINDSFDFEPQNVMSPLPRAFQWADGSAYVNHVELVRKARGAEMPKNFWTDPLMYQGGSDSFIGPRDDIIVADESWGIDFESEIAIVTDDVPMGVSSENAAKHIKLFMILNDVSLRNLIPNEIAKSFGFFHSKPATAFSPVAITPDELGTAWDKEKVHLPLHSHLNSELFGKPNAGVDMTFNFPQLIEHAAKSRFLASGSIIGSGTVSNVDRSNGSSCIAEKRMLEIIETGKPVTPFMKYGDDIKIEMFDHDNNSIFGAISQKVCAYN